MPPKATEAIYYTKIDLEIDDFYSILIDALVLYSLSPQAKSPELAKELKNKLYECNPDKNIHLILS